MYLGSKTRKVVGRYFTRDAAAEDLNEDLPMTDPGKKDSDAAAVRARPRRISPSPAVATKPRQFGSRWVRATLAAVSAATLAVMGLAYATVGNLNNDLAQADNLELGKQVDGATDILLVGVDSRTDAKGNPLSPEEIKMLRAGDEPVTNTDTMILIRVPNDGSYATAVSIPRDAYVKTESMGNMKLNGVFGSAKFEKAEELSAAGASAAEIEEQSTSEGRHVLVETIANLTGITVDHYAEVGLLGFVLLTDAVGGVPVCLNHPVNEPLSGAKFPAGQQTLNGPDALSFVRQRYNLPRGDLDRITRQQAYMASLASKVISSNTLTDPGAIARLNKAVQRSVVVDSGWDIMSLASQLQNLAGGNVSFQTIPVTSIDGTGDNGESIVTVDYQQVREYFANLLGDKETAGAAQHKAMIPKYDPHDYTINAYNGSETEGLAGRVSTWAKNRGFTPGEVTNYTGQDKPTSHVAVLNPDDPAAVDLAAKLGNLPIVEDPKLEPKTLEIVIADGFNDALIRPKQPAPASPSGAAPATAANGGADASAQAEAAPRTSGEVVGTEGTPNTERITKPVNAGKAAPTCVN